MSEYQEGEDTIIDISSEPLIGTCQNSEETVIRYGPAKYKNIDKILQEYKSKSNDDKERFEQFIRDLDQKVYIDPTDPSYEPIYSGIDLIVQRICQRLPEADSIFQDITHRLVGSVSAGVKVALPHEADYLLEISNGQEIGAKILKTRFYSAVKDIFTTDRYHVLQDMDMWTLHKVKNHIHVCGICLVMEYDYGNDHNSVGVTVDLVLARVVTEHDDNMGLTTWVSKEYLIPSLKHSVRNGDVYMLVGKGNCLDTGIIENRIVSQLPEDKKRGYRVAKYLYLIFAQQNILLWYPEFVGEQKSLRLYGYKSWINSFYFRQLFLGLIYQTKGTALDGELVNGALVLCLLDIIAVIYSRKNIRILEVQSRSQIIKEIFMSPRITGFNLLRRKLKQLKTSEKQYIDLENYKLINSEKTPLVTSMYRIQNSATHMCCTVDGMLQLGLVLYCSIILVVFYKYAEIFFYVIYN